jgi:hypothetical protein
MVSTNSIVTTKNTTNTPTSTVMRLMKFDLKKVSTLFITLIFYLYEFVKDVHNGF